VDKLDRAALAEQNGQDGKKAYVAVEGRIYDVTTSKRWPKGKHMNRHPAGSDLSAELKAAPHGADVLERFTQVGELAAEAAAQDGPRVFWPLSWVFAKFPILKRHAHPVAVHFPIASMAASFVFAALALATGRGGFAATSFNMVIFGTLLAPFALITGIQSWWLFYGMKVSGGLLVKLIGAPVLILLGIVGIAIQDYGALTTAAPMGYAYAAVTGAVAGLALLLGYIGGQMTFPD
jgi:predicted heme/steroid binding protein/uncharacterized membrane protein